MSEHDPESGGERAEREAEERADEGEAGATEMEEESARLSDEIDEVRSDWEQKKGDPTVPGAVGDEEEASAGDDDEA
jgi:hypothetical protein